MHTTDPLKTPGESRPVLVWDWPTRLFHWVLAGGVLAAFAIAQLVRKRDPLFPYHAMIGIVLATMVVMRVIWGIIGTRYARFGSFLYGPVAVIEYVRGVFTGQGGRHIGHNPGSSYAIFAMLALVLLIVATGLMMGFGIEAGEELHSAAAYVLIGVVVVHVAGVIIHTIRHRENITWSMISGRKLADAAAGIRSSRPLAGIVLLAVVAYVSAELIRNYDAASRSTRLPLLGKTVQLTENEGGKSKPFKSLRREDDD